MRTTLALFLGLLSLTATPAFAEDTPKDDICSYGGSWEGPGDTTIVILQSQEQFDESDQVYISVENSIWSLKEGSRIGTAKFMGNNGGFTAEPVAVDHGFIVGPSFELFEKVFNTAGGMSISIGQKEIDRVDLSSVYTKFLDFKECHSLRVSKKSEIDRKKYIQERFGKDPFSK